MGIDRAIIDSWAQRKLERESFRPIGDHVVSREWLKMTGRALFGSVTLRVSPSDDFRFIDRITWPERADVFSECVRDGILDALLIDLRVAPGGEFTLESIEWREGESVPHAYGQAARAAVEELFGLYERDRLGQGR